MNQARPESPLPKIDTPPGIVWIDVAISRFANWVLIPLILVLAPLVAGLMVIFLIAIVTVANHFNEAYPAIGPIAVLVILGLLVLLLVAAMQAWAGYFARRVAAIGEVDDVLDRFRRSVSTRELVQSRTGAAALARALYRAGRTGWVIRTGRARMLGPIRPLDVNFEPLPLDETQATLQELWRETQPEDASTAEVVAQGSGFSLGRTVLLGGGLRSLIPLLVVFLFVTIASWRPAGPGRGAYLWGALLIFWFLWALRPQRSGRVMLVPAGLIDRTREGWRLFAARDSVLVVHRHKREPTRHVSIVGCGGRLLQLRLTPRELDCLLAAWISPLEPPSGHLLSSLAT